jgi:hypothetical protein
VLIASGFADKAFGPFRYVSRTSAPGFRPRRTSNPGVAESDYAAEDQAFVDAVSEPADETR